MAYIGATSRYATLQSAMDVCYSGFLYSTLSTFNLSFYSLKQCTTLHKNSGGDAAKTGGGA